LNPSPRLGGRRGTLGLYLSCHPFAPYEADLSHLASGRIADFAGERPPPPALGARPFAESRSVTLAGLILEVRRRGTRVSFMLDDRSARMEVTLFEEIYQRHRDLIVKDAIVQVEGSLRFDEFSDAWRLHAKLVQPLHGVRERLARSMLLLLPASPQPPALLAALEQLLRAARGGQCAVALQYCASGLTGTLRCADEWKISPSAELIERLEELLGPQSVRLSYASPALSAAMGH